MRQQQPDRAGRAGERGSVMAISAFGMLAFVLALGLCVDVSHFYVVNAELQNAADAASLAGASALNSSAGGIAEAVTRARRAMNSYEFNNQSVTLKDENIKFAVNLDGPYMSAADAEMPAVASDIRFVQVQVPPEHVGVFFSMSALGRNRVDLSQKAVAGMSVSPNVFCDWIPLSVIDSDTSPMTPPNLYIIRGGAQGSVSPGNRQILAVAGRGANEAKYGIAKGVNDCAEPGSVYTKDTKPGVDSGPVRDGINTRFDDYAGGLDPVQYPPDVNVKEDITWAQYRNATPGSADWQSPRHTGVPMRRVVLIPLVRQSEFDPGRDTVRFYKFAAFFLRKKVDNGSGDIVAEYIGERLVFGKNAYKPGGGPVNPQLTQPVLYR